MLTSFVVLVRDPQAQTFSWCPAIADDPQQAMALVGQKFTAEGEGGKMLVGAFTREQVFSAGPLFDHMDTIIKTQA